MLRDGAPALLLFVQASTYRCSAFLLFTHVLSAQPSVFPSHSAAGPFRAQFLQEAVADLRAALRAAGSELIVRLGKPEEVGSMMASAVAAIDRMGYNLAGLRKRKTQLCSCTVPVSSTPKGP